MAKKFKKGQQYGIMRVSEVTENEVTFVFNDMVGSPHYQTREIRRESNGDEYYIFDELIKYQGVVKMYAK
jgi:hypothetical protein